MCVGASEKIKGTWTVGYSHGIKGSSCNSKVAHIHFLRADGEYSWNKIIPFSHQSETPELKYGHKHEPCHTKGVHYDLIVLKMVHTLLICM